MNRIWSPPQSQLRIEYSPRLIQELGIRGTNGESTGILFGAKDGTGLRILAARRLAGLEAVGMFFVRPRGEVFLTEPNLRQLEQLPNAVALVIAGDQGGFFVREPDGSMQTIQSYQEFP